MDVDQLVTKLLQSIADGNLAILAGAGLSMSSPSNAPGAAVVANDAVRRHREYTGEQLPEEIHWDLEKVAQHFYHDGKLSTYFVRQLVDWIPFRAVPNRGHVAIADFLACGAVDVAVTTNYDALVEAAARGIGEINFHSSWDGAEANQTRPHRPYLKIYGCCVREVESTVWCVEQITDEPLATRLDRSRQFLQGRLLDRDLLIMGFWSDWNYLNFILESALPANAKGHIFLVDPLPDAKLKAKARDLWTWAGQHNFVHVEAFADEVLDRLRNRFSQLLLRRIMSLTGAQVDWIDGLDGHEAFAIRRDLAGVNAVARDRTETPFMSAFALAHERLRASGGVFAGDRYSIAGKNVRVVHAAGILLAQLRAEFEKAPELTLDLDAVVCAGAQDDAGLASNVLRADAQTTVIRGGSRELRLFTSAEELLRTEFNDIAR